MTPRTRRRTFWGLPLCMALVAGCVGSVGLPAEEPTHAARPSPGGGSQGGQAPPAANDPGRGGPDPTTGAPPAASPGDGSETIACAIDPASTPPQRIRRLTNQEYENVVADAVGKRVDASLLSADVQVAGMVNDATSLIITGTRFDEYAQLASRIAGAEAERLAGCKVGEAGRECARRFVTSFGRRLFGRPLTEPEIEKLSGANGLYDKGQNPGGHTGGLVLVARALLLSPHFLYRAEIGEGSGGLARLTPFELASNLSFFLTGSRPDEDLLRAAELGKLDDPVELEKQARRLASSVRGQRRLREFLMGWLGASHLEGIEKDPAVFPELTGTLKTAMKRELEAFVDHVLGQAGTLDELLTASYAFPDAELAQTIYKSDLVGTAGSFTRVPLDPRRRKGVLSLAGFLAGHSSARHSGPVERGVFVRAKLMCLPQPPVPANIPISPVDQGAPGKTTRQQFEQHVADPVCSACHKLFDPIGFGLETMDGIGRHRTSENGVAVDARGHMPVDADVQGAFQGPAELATLLAGSGQVRSCLAVNALRFADGVVSDALSPCEARKAAEVFGAPGKKISELWIALAQRSSMAVRAREPMAKGE